ncbi:MAG: hypothetical protein NVSMB32_08020 [Actinomycetota bacterium]
MGAQLIVLIPLVGLFYLLLIRPQKKRLRQHEDLVGTLKLGDEIVTIGGIIGYVKKVDDETITLEVADGFHLRVVKQAIGRKVTTPPVVAAGGVAATGVDEAIEEPHEPDGTE